MANTFEHALEAGYLTFEVFCARRGEFVNADATVGGRDAPFGLDQFFFEKTLQGWIQRPFFDLKQVLRSSLDVLNERIAVRRLAPEGLENHHLQRTGKEVSLCGFLHATDSFGLPGLCYQAILL